MVVCVMQAKLQEQLFKDIGQMTEVRGTAMAVLRNVRFEANVDVIMLIASYKLLAICVIL